MMSRIISGAPRACARFRQLYVNGKKAIRARYPNLESDGSHNFFRLTKVGFYGACVRCLQFVYRGLEEYGQSGNALDDRLGDAVLRIEKIEKKNGTTSKVIPQDPERSKLFRRKYPMLGTAFMSNPPKQQCFYFENAYEFIDQPGNGTWTNPQIYFTINRGRGISYGERRRRSEYRNAVRNQGRKHEE